jgi:hypothetical protein
MMVDDSEAALWMQAYEHHCSKIHHSRKYCLAWETETMQWNPSDQGAPEVALFPFPADEMTEKTNLAVQLRTVVIAFDLEPGFAANLQSAVAGHS